MVEGVEGQGVGRADEGPELVEGGVGGSLLRQPGGHQRGGGGGVRWDPHCEWQQRF